MAQTVKGLSTMQETRIWSLSREDPLEKEIAAPSSTAAAAAAKSLQYYCLENPMDGGAW